MSTDERIYPFSCGSQYTDWQAGNCDGCLKYNPEKFDGACDIDGAIGLAYIGEGWVTPEIAQRMGYIGNEDAYGWPCPERNPAWLQILVLPGGGGFVKPVG